MDPLGQKNISYTGAQTYESIQFAPYHKKQMEQQI